MRGRSSAHLRVVLNVHVRGSVCRHDLPDLLDAPAGRERHEGREHANRVHIQLGHVRGCREAQEVNDPRSTVDLDGDPEDAMVVARAGGGRDARDREDPADGAINGRCESLVPRAGEADRLEVEEHAGDGTGQFAAPDVGVAAGDDPADPALGPHEGLEGLAVHVRLPGGVEARCRRGNPTIRVLPTLDLEVGAALGGTPRGEAFLVGVAGGDHEGAKQRQRDKREETHSSPTFLQHTSLVVSILTQETARLTCLGQPIAYRSKISLLILATCAVCQDRHTTQATIE